MNHETFSPYDPAEYLENEADMQLYLQIALEENGIKGFQHALGVVARAKGMSDIAQKTGLGRQNLYKALSDTANPKLETVAKIVEAMGLKLTVRAKV